jgi:hypothetical protein
MDDFHLHEMSSEGKSTEAEGQLEGSQAWEGEMEGNEETLVLRAGLLFREMESIVVIFAQLHEHTKNY